MGSSLDDLRDFPLDVQDEVGFALYQAQRGGKHVSAKPLKGQSGAGVLEVVANHAGNTYRAVYTVKFAAAAYVLHVFQKKSKRGIKTPKEELELITKRRRRAAEHYKEYHGREHGQE
jgi:phage-related protein